MSDAKSGTRRAEPKVMDEVKATLEANKYDPLLLGFENARLARENAVLEDIVRVLSDDQREAAVRELVAALEAFGPAMRKYEPPEELPEWEAVCAALARLNAQPEG